MDFRQLEALVAVVDAGSFSKAGKALATAQSNISTRVKNLEAELGVSLVDRETMEPTPEGRSVLERARRILVEEESIGTDVKSMSETVQGDVSIGMIGTTGRWLIPHLLHAQRATYPNIYLRIVEGTNSALKPRLATGELNVAILSMPLLPDSFRYAELFDEDLVLVTPTKGKRAIAGDQVKLRDITTLDLLLPLSGTPLRNEIDEACELAHVTLTPRIEMDGIRTLASLCFDGEGYAVLPATAIPAHLKLGFRGIRISDLPPRRVALTLPPYGLPSTPTLAVHQLIKEIVGSDASLPSGLHRI